MTVVPVGDCGFEVHRPPAVATDDLEIDQHLNIAEIGNIRRSQRSMVLTNIDGCEFGFDDILVDFSDN